MTGCQTCFNCILVNICMILKNRDDTLLYPLCLQRSFDYYEAHYFNGLHNSIEWLDEGGGGGGGEGSGKRSMYQDVSYSIVSHYQIC